MNQRLRMISIVFVLMLCIFGALGLGRFAFGAILPFMKEGLSFNYSQTGFVASAIFFGYLISAFLSGHFVIRYTAKKVIMSSLCLITVGMVIIAFSQHLFIAFIGSLVMGIGSGGANIPALGVVANWFAPKKRGLAMGIVNSGSGLGMLFSGVIVPILVSYNPTAGWRISWMILATFILCIVIINIFLLKNNPNEVGMHPIGEGKKVNITTNSRGKKQESRSVYKNKMVWGVGFTYLTWGFSYLIFSTFLVDYLINDVGFEKKLAGQYFAAAGLISIFSGFLWGAISDSIGRIPTLIIVYAYQGIFLLLMGVTENPVFLFLEVLCYGLSLWAVPTITNTSVSEFVEPHLIPIAMGFLTFFFGIGQLVSPIVTGMLIDATDNYMYVFLLSALVIMCGSVLSGVLQYRMKKQQSMTG